MSTPTSAVPVSPIVPIGHGRRSVADMLDKWAARYPNPNTRAAYIAWVDKLFRFAGTTHPEDLTEGHVAQWAASPSDKPWARAEQPANNTVRARLMAARSFLAWARRNGYQVQEMDLSHLRKAYPKTYGKVQARYQARFLTKDELRSLIAACQDGTWAGSKDQLIIRLGTHGLRLHELVNLQWRDLRGNQLHWTGKGNHPRTVTTSPTLTDLLARWHRYLETLAPVADTDPVLPATKRNGPRTDIVPGKRSAILTIRDRVTYRARLAGLGYVSPHDLRRTCASVLYNTRTADGARKYDLRDVQKVLGHASPDTTDRSYLSQVDRDHLDRAAQDLD